MKSRIKSRHLQTVECTGTQRLPWFYGCDWLSEFHRCQDNEKNGADYLLAAKCNHGSLEEGVKCVGSALDAFSHCCGRFPRACPRTVRTRLCVYGSPLINSLYLPCSCIIALHVSQTARVLRFLFSMIPFHSYSANRVFSIRMWCITARLSAPHPSQCLILSLCTSVG